MSQGCYGRLEFRPNTTMQAWRLNKESMFKTIL